MQPNLRSIQKELKKKKRLPKKIMEKMSLTFFFTKLFFNYQNIELISVKNVYDRTSRVSPKMSEKVS